MRKIGGLAIITAFVLAGCSAPVAQPAATEPAPSASATTRWITKDGQPFDISTVTFKDSAIGAFKDAAADIPGYSKTSPDALASIGHELCEHYAGGFTTEDLRQTSGDALAELGDAAKVTVCAKP